MGSPAGAPQFLPRVCAMEPRLTPAELRQKMLRRLSTPDPGQTAEKVPWRLVVMDRAARAFVASLPCHELDVVEIGGRAWSDPGFGFRSYRSLSSPPWDLSREPAEPESCSLAILDQGLERARHPRQALTKVLAMLRPGGSLLVSSSFLLKLEPRSPDLRRWTEDGLRTLLEEAGFTAIATGSWGNRQCLAADLQAGVEGTSYDPAVHTLENEVECPLAVWAFARKPAGRVAPSGQHSDLRTRG